MIEQPKGKYVWECPKCGTTMGTDVKLSTPPNCRNEEKHHHNRALNMVLITAKDPE